jgi:hypothetical protein
MAEKMNISKTNTVNGFTAMVDQPTLGHL